jgi:signal transduction histidine kinase
MFKAIGTRFNILIFLIFFVLLLTLGLVQLVMSPPAGDLIYLAIYLSITALISAAFSFISLRLGWWRRLPRLSYALILGYVLAGALTLFNVWITARLMFINQHDLALGSMLLLFAGGISITFGYFLSIAITSALEKVTQGAERLSQGDFSVRVDVHGQDEVSRLAAAFNEMSTRLESAAQAERALDNARRNLIAWASHDLRTPLTSLNAMIAALADGVVDDPETVTRYLQQSQVEVNRLNALIDDLFELAQLDAGGIHLEFEWFSLSDLVSDTLESFAAQANSHKVNIKGSVSPKIDPVWAAPDKLSRILDNLISNALRHTPEGGNVQLQAGIQGEMILVTVEDNGSGIAPEDTPYVFDRFYRGDRSRMREDTQVGGSGLGLAIAKGLVEAHGGQIGMDTMLDIGSRFWFTIPRKSITPRDG